MTVKFFSPETKPPQFYSQSLELVTLVIVINVVIGSLSGEALRLSDYTNSLWCSSQFSDVQLYFRCNFVVFFSQDFLISRYQSKVADSKLTVRLKYVKKNCDEAFKALTPSEEDSFEMNANALEGVAKGRYVLSLVADTLYKWFIEGDSSYTKDLDVEREAGCLLDSAKQLCMEGPSTKPQLYLLKQLVRRFGFDCVRTMGGYEELEWILPPEARQQVSKLATMNGKRIDCRFLWI